MKILGEWRWCLPQWLQWLPTLAFHTRRRRAASISDTPSATPRGAALPH